jgi:8-oxo-dGTP pyrophosphatase MutT (NUDIX family)
MELSFQTDGRKFLYRVGGIAVRDGRVLVHQWPSDDDFYCVPGGRAEFGEDAAGALRREMREELGCEVTVGRLLWVVENFFTYAGVETHEVGFYFAIELPDDCMQASGQPWTGHEVDGSEMYFSWQPIDRLHKIELKPSFLITALRSLPTVTAYVVHRDG